MAAEEAVQQIHGLNIFQNQDLNDKNMKNVKRRIRDSVTLTFGILIISTSCLRRVENRIPLLQDRIMDRADLLSENQEDSIFSLIKELDVSLGPQIAVLTVDSLNGEDIETLAWRTADEIGLGRTTFRDGILICVSKRDQSIRISIDKGLKRIVGDDSAKFINTKIIIPEFRDDNYFLGLYKGVSHLKKSIEREPELIGKM